MPLALVGTIGASTLYTSGSTASPAYGQTPTAGNLLVLWCSVTGTATLPTTPSGWTISKQQAGTSCSATIYHKVAAGADAAPTIPGITSGSIATRLGEFSGQSSTPLASSGGAAGTTSGLAATNAVVDSASGALMASVTSLLNSAARTNATWAETYVNGTSIQVNNSGSSLTTHYGHSYAITTANAVVDKDTFAFTTTQLTGACVALASFNANPVVVGTGTGAITFAGSGTATVLVNPTGTGAITFAGSGTATFVAPTINASGTGAISFNGTGTAVFTVAGGPPVGNFAGWYDASRITGQADNTALATWHDLSGSGNDLTQATGTSQPTYYSSTAGKTVNSLPAVWFNGGQSMASSAGSQAQPFTICAMVRTVSGPVSQMLWNSNDQQAYIFAYSSGWQPFAGNYTGWVATPPDTNLHSLEFVFNGALSSFTMDGVAQLPATEDIGPNGYTLGIRLGTWAGGDFWNGPICELLIYPSALSSTDLATVNTYLTNKWVPQAVTVPASGTGAISFGGSGTAIVTTSTTGTGAITFGSTGTAKVTVNPTGTGAITFAGAGAATVTTTATGTGAITFGGSGVASYGVLVTATGTGAITFGGSGTATFFVPATGTGAITFGGAGAPKVIVNPTGTGAITFGGSGTGKVTVNPTGTGAIVFAGSGTASFFIPATGTGAIVFGGAGTAKVGLSTSGTGAITFGGAGTAAAGNMVPATGTGAIVFGGSGTATVGISTSGSGAIVFGGSGTATFHVTVNATGTGAIVFNASGTAIVTTIATGTGAIVFNGVGVAAITAVRATGIGAILFDGIGIVVSTAKGFPTLAEQIAALAGVDSSMIGATGYAEVMATARLEPGQDPIVVGVTNMDAVATARLEPGQDPIVVGVTDLDEVFPQRLEGPTQ